MCSAASTINQHVTPIVTGIGMLFSSFGVLVFLQIILIKRPRTNMFAYFLVATISDLFNHTTVLFGMKYACSTCPSWFSLSQIGQWYIKVYNYMPAVFNDITAFMQVGATIDCYISIRSKYPALQSRLAFCVVTVFVIVYSFSYEVNLWFKYDLRIVDQRIGLNGTFNQTQKVLAFIETGFAKSVWSKIMFVYSSGVRDLACFLVLLLFNTLIVCEMRSSTRRKTQLFLTRRGTDISMSNLNTTTSLAAVAIMHAASSYNVRKACQAESKRAIMVIVSGVNYFLGHTGYFFVAIAISFLTITPSWRCFGSIELLLLYLSNVTCYAAYYFSNKLFRQYSNQNLYYIFHPVCLALNKLLNRSEAGKRDKGQ